LIGRSAPASQIVRELALHGVAALEAGSESSAQARDFLVAVADGAAGLDGESLRTVRERAWR
jgi:hypothetical protein